MMNVADIKLWLSYWKKTLVDVDRKRIDITTSPVLVESYFINKIPQKQAKFLWSISSTNKETKCINVDICPCSIQSKFEHAKSKAQEEEVFYPFWIPAIMYKDGALAPQKNKKKVSKPFFVREYLTPNPKDTYSVASIKEVDTALRKVEFKDESWEHYWKKCESFFKLVTGKSFEEFNIKHEKYIFVQKGELRGLTENIRKLYNRLEESLPQDNLLNTLIGNRSINYTTIPSKCTVVRNRNHLGQMSNEFPLSVSQRESIACFNLLEESNILAVNGPPGTGKTTFLQSVVANSVVSTVVNQQKPKLIIACSANNQAITNILDSFVLEQEDELVKRWLPNITSLGLYFSIKDNNKYQTCTSEYGSGFLNDFEATDLDSKKQFFVEKICQNIGKCTDIKESKEKLLNIVQSKVANTKKYIDVAENYENIKQLLEDAKFSDFDDLVENISLVEDNIYNCNAEIQQISNVEKQLIQANDSQPFLRKIFYFIPKFKKHKASLFKRILLDIKFEKTPNYNNYSDLIHLLNEAIISKTNTVKQLKEKLISLSELKSRIEESTSNYNTCIDSWNDNYGEKYKSIQLKTGKEYVDLRPLEDMQVRMDISYRYEAFWYAIHFREAEYLLNLEKWIEKSSRDKGRSKIKYREKLQRFAGITPIYISTFHSIPRFSTFFDVEGEKAFYDLFDILIVDEAGQVAPDISIPSFSLAKKAIVVGDVFQIEPVWSVEEKLDVINLKMNNLLKENSSDDLLNHYKDLGLLCSSGNLMKLAQQSCFIRDNDEGGTLLKEHRRCPDKIISFSNEYVYRNKLILAKGNKRKDKLKLPFKGFMHIDSVSEKIGNSRQNNQDADIIVKWIDDKREELKETFKDKDSTEKKSIAEILAIITPYKSQATLIKRKLLKINKKEYKNIISGTAHALQGAEIDIVIFSSVITPRDSTFFADNLNMLNVAVSRAKSSFLVFGNLNAIDATKSNPLGRLKKWLQEDEDCELSNKIVFDNKSEDNEIQRVNDLKTHVGMLNRAFEIAKSELIIVSPFISSNAIETELVKYNYDDEKKKFSSLKIKSIKNQIYDTVKRGVKVTIVTDSTLDLQGSKLKPTAQKGREIIKQNGAILKLVDGIHSKTIIVDDDIMVEGSFNWFSALRDEQSKYFREESSIVVQGKFAQKMIEKAKTYLKGVIK
ncbi:MAG: hypothetical protein H6604_05320 [Flavobacteriales bacterium]|nr:hypothetical protein [Flavobacteriales bacterium]